MLQFATFIFEDLGSFARPLDEAGYHITYLEAGLQGLTIAQDADLLVVLGGPIGVGGQRRLPLSRG